MERYDILVANQHRDNLLAGLHDAGIAELRDLRKEETEGVALGEKHELLQEMEESSSKIARLVAIMEKASPPVDGGLGAMLSPPKTNKTVVKKKTRKKLLEDASSILQTLEKPLHDLERIHEKITQDIDGLKARSNAISHLSGLDIDLGNVGLGDMVFVTVGTTTNPDGLMESLSPFNTMVEVCPINNVMSSAMAVGLVKDEKNIMSVMKSAGFSPMHLGDESGSPQEAIRTIDSKMRQKGIDLNRCIGSIRDLRKKYLQRLRVVREELEIEQERASAVQKMVKTSTTHVLSVWCPVRDLEKLNVIVDKETQSTGILRPGETEEEPPIAVSNPHWAKPFTMITNMYGVPGYSEVDPTKIIAPVFVIFFGIMLGDAVYGLLTVLTGLVIRRAAGEDEGMRWFSTILTLSGISAVVFGIIQGGYLGPITETQPNIIMMLGFTPPVLLDAMTDPITLLVISLLVGLAYINLGLLLGMVQNIKRREIKRILLEQFPWWLLQPAGFILVGEGLFGWWTFTPEVRTLGIAMALGGTLLLVVGKGGLFFFEITGFLGNFLSFARILALGLATAGIALTINVLVDMVAGASMDVGLLAYPIAIASVPLLAMGLAKKKPVFSIVGSLLLFMGASFILQVGHVFFLFIAVCMFIFAHIMNCGLQALGAFIHSLRLQYVEFFGLFFEGGGRPFTPFQPERKNTIPFKEEQA